MLDFPFYNYASMKYGNLWY